MQISYHKHFKKRFKKLPPKVKDAFRVRVELFQMDHFHALLGNHALSGKYSGCRSINITGDYRAIYVHYVQIGDVIQFLDIGTHAELYE